MLVVETIAKIRRAHFVEGKSIKQICRELRLSRIEAIAPLVRAMAEGCAKSSDRARPSSPMNAWLEDRCIAYASANQHPDIPDKTIREVFKAEQTSLIPYIGPFDGFHAVPASVSKTVDIYVDRAFRQEPVFRRRPSGRAARRDQGLCRQAGMLAGWSGRRPARSRLWPCQDDLRSAPLHPGSGPQARCIAQ